ncbi:MAG: hypothetical protein COA88_12735 [Kordia sp.]|nr:MAG: hypothetical protein COA88_12735 [Kordia sp.]
MDNKGVLNQSLGIDMKESGNYHGQSRISKKGNKHIRAILHMQQ